MPDDYFIFFSVYKIEKTLVFKLSQRIFNLCVCVFVSVYPAELTSFFIIESYLVI